jgi:hypothetical protein
VPYDEEIADLAILYGLTISSSSSAEKRHDRSAFAPSGTPPRRLSIDESPPLTRLSRVVRG